MFDVSWCLYALAALGGYLVHMAIMHLRIDRMVMDAMEEVMDDLDDIGNDYSYTTIRREKQEAKKVDVKKPFIVKLDYFFNKVLPKKLLVWVIATVALFLKLIDGNVWMIISGVYLGANIIGHFAPPQPFGYQDQPGAMPKQDGKP